ncbi:MAG TPA: hypothetical protein VIJ57_03265, partial [Hanamia sp.]
QLNFILTLISFVPKQTPHLINALCKATVCFFATGILQAMMIYQASHNNVHAMALASRPVIVRHFGFNRWLFTK